MPTTRPTPAAMHGTGDSGVLLDLSQQLRQAARQLREAVGRRRQARGAGGD
jgi:hypothetical protein